MFYAQILIFALILNKPTYRIVFCIPVKTVYGNARINASWFVLFEETIG